MAIAPAGRACAVRGGRAGRRRQLARGCALRSPPVATRGGFAKNSGWLGSARRGGRREAAGLQRSPPRPLGAERAGPRSGDSAGRARGRVSPGRARGRAPGLRCPARRGTAGGGALGYCTAPSRWWPLPALGAGHTPARPASPGTALGQRGRRGAAGHASGTAPLPPRPGFRRRREKGGAGCEYDSDPLGCHSPG